MTIGIFADSKQQGPPFSPEQLTGLMGWWDASDTSSIVHIANAVSQWNDKSPNLFHVTQATGTKQPLTNTSTINGKNALLFDGTDDFLSRTAPVQIVHPITGEFTLYGVVKIANVTGARSILDQDSGAGITRIFTFKTNNTFPQVVVFNTVPTAFTEGQAAVTIGQTHYFTAIRRATDTEIFKAGLTNGLTATTGTNATSNWNLGLGGSPRPTPISFWMGEIGEVIAYNVAHATLEKNKVENYLKAKWGL